MKKIVACISLMVLFAITPAFATTSYTVKKGDSLHKIAKKHSVSVAEIKRLNHLTSKKIKVGQKLVLKGAAQGSPASDEALMRVIEKKLSKRPSASKDFDAWEAQVQKLEQLATLPAPGHQEATIAPSVSPLNDSTKNESIKAQDLSNLSIRDRMILFSKRMLHLPYKFGGNSVFGIDCSAFVKKVYRIAGMELPRSAREQYKVGEPVKREELAVGDLVFFRTYASFPSHVGIYLGNNLFIHASSRSKKVTIDSLESPYFFKHFIGARKLLPEEIDLEGTPQEKKE